MDTTVLPVIASRFLSRKCLLYSVAQGSLSDVALALGWPATALEPFPGTPGSAGGADLRHIRNRLASREIGALIVSDIRRVVWGADQLDRLFTLASAVDALIMENTRILRSGDEFRMSALATVMAQFDQDRCTELAMRALWARAQLGCAVSPPPGGYEPIANGQWIQDRDLHVRDAYSAVFRAYLDLHSAEKVAAWCSGICIELPIRTGGMLRYSKVTADRIRGILRNPAYQGDYIFGAAPMSARFAREPRPAWAQPVYIRDHHAAYVGRTDFARIQQQLGRRRRKPVYWQA